MSVPFQHIIDNPFNVQGDNRPAAFVGFQEEAVVGVVVEEILRQSGGTEGILQDVEVAFLVGISVGVVFPELVSRVARAQRRFHERELISRCKSG